MSSSIYRVKEKATLKVLFVFCFYLLSLTAFLIPGFTLAADPASSAPSPFTMVERPGGGLYVAPIITITSVTGTPGDESSVKINMAVEEPYWTTNNLGRYVTEHKPATSVSGEEVRYQLNSKTFHIKIGASSYLQLSDSLVFEEFGTIEQRGGNNVIAPYFGYDNADVTAVGVGAIGGRTAFENALADYFRTEPGKEARKLFESLKTYAKDNAIKKTITWTSQINQVGATILGEENSDNPIMKCKFKLFQGDGEESVIALKDGDQSYKVYNIDNQLTIKNGDKSATNTFTREVELIKGKTYTILTYFIIARNAGSSEINQACLEDGEIPQEGFFEPIERLKRGAAGKSGDLYFGKITFVADGETTQNIPQLDINYIETLTEGGALQNMLNSIFTSLLNGVKKLLSLTAHAVDHVLDKGNDIDNESIKELWKTSRNLAMSLILAIIILVAFANVIQFKPEQYNIGRMIPRLFISMMLVYISYIYVQFLLSIAVVLQETFKGGMDFAKEIAKPVYNPTMGAGDALAMVGLILLILILMLAVILTMIYLIVILILRIVMIWFLAAIAPIGFLCRVLPFSEGLYVKWRDTLIKWVFMGPVVMYMLYFTTMALKAFPNIFGEPGDDYSSTNAYIYMVIVAVCLFLSATVPVTLGGSVMGKFAGKVKGAGMKPIRGLGRATGRATSKFAQNKTGIAAARDFMKRRSATIDRTRDQKRQARFSKVAASEGKVPGWAAGQGGLIRESKRDLRAQQYAKTQMISAYGENIKDADPEKLYGRLKGTKNIFEKTAIIGELQNQKSLELEKVRAAGAIEDYYSMIEKTNPNFNGFIMRGALDNTKEIMKDVTDNYEMADMPAGAKVIAEKIRMEKPISDWDDGDFQYAAKYHPEIVAAALTSRDTLYESRNWKKGLKSSAGAYIQANPQLSQSLKTAYTKDVHKQLLGTYNSEKTGAVKDSGEPRVENGRLVSIYENHDKYPHAITPDEGLQQEEPPLQNRGAGMTREPDSQQSSSEMNQSTNASEDSQNEPPQNSN